MPKRISVVVSQSPSKNPAKRALEEEIVAGLLMEPGVDVTVIPNLYDLAADSTGMLALQGVNGNLVVCSWLFERAAHWILDRNKIHGHVGTVLLKSESDDEDEEEMEEEAEEKPRVLDSREIPNRHIYCLDLRVSNQASEYLQEIKRIQSENDVQVMQLGGMNGAATAEQRARFENPTNDTALAADGNGLASPNGSPRAEANGDATVKRVEDQSDRRWYPVIDYSRCTNCMECIDFCLFGVYGVDTIETILVEQPDNCRKGCPACSRVCPENAIIFPQHKTPAIAGADEVGASLKIDLSQLFGAPDQSKSAIEVAALERDEQLLAAGRDAVGMSVGIPKRQPDQPDQPKDDMDDLIDQLDELDI